MEKYVAELLKIQNLKVRYQSHIHNDIASSIHLKLSIKSLKRFGCVCKSWFVLFDNPIFMIAYLKNFLSKDHPYYNDKSLLLYGDDVDTFELYSVSDERFENKVQLNWPKVTLNESCNDSGFEIIGPSSVNGTLCLTCEYGENMALWNPSTDEFKVIPPSPFHSGGWVYHRGFGYDSVRNDFKVLRNLQVIQKTNCYPKDKSIWEIYSLRRNSWKKLDVDMHHNQMGCEPLYIDGLSHWLSKSKPDDIAYLLSFDWSNEVFLTTPLPSDMEDIFLFPVKSHLVLLNGSIALIMFDRKTGRLRILILGELGVKESWTKIFNVGPLPSFDLPIVGGKKGRMLFEKKDRHLAWLDLNTQMIEDLDLSTEKFDFRILFHKENLVPLPFEGINL